MHRCVVVYLSLIEWHALYESNIVKIVFSIFYEIVKLARACYIENFNLHGSLAMPMVHWGCCRLLNSEGREVPFL